VSNKVEAGNKVATGNDLVVVHSASGSLTKGILEFKASSESVIPPAPLPEALHIKCGAAGEDKVIPLCETKAVFFVKEQDGNREHDEVKFFSDVTPQCLWIRVQFPDGEVLEGRTENSRRLLFDPGIWLQPFDTITNNFLVYIPKSSVVAFHIMGVTDAQGRKA